jgi:hypothetical protein
MVLCNRERTKEKVIAFAKPHGTVKYMKRNYIRKAIEVIDGMKSRSEMGDEHGNELSDATLYGRERGSD